MKKTFKKFISVLLVFIMLMAVAPVGGLDLLNLSTESSALSSSGKCGDNVYYTFDESTGKLTISGTGEMDDYDWYGSPFYENSSIKTVVIENGVTSIGDYAFHCCPSLKSITIPDSVTSIGYSAFNNTGYYNDYTNWEDDVLYISNCLINAKTSVSGEYQIKAGTKTIAGYAFYNCTSLTSITIPDSVKRIGYSTFDWCTSLTSVTIGNGVTSIGSYAFYNCTSLTSITIPDSVMSIDYGAFHYCKGLTSLTIGNGVTSIGESAFGYCTSLTGITIPDSVTSIGDYAFDMVNNISYSSKMKATGSPWGAKAANGYIEDGIVYNDSSKTSLLGCAASKTGSVIILDSVTSIGDYAFYGCESITSVTIPDSVTSIGYCAFACCYNLTSITIPDSVTSIGDYAFDYCTSLTSITIPDSVTSIYEGAFKGCTSLTSITIPVSVTSIDYWVFRDCDSLSDVYYSGTEGQWDYIEIGEDNDPLLDADIHFGKTEIEYYDLKYKEAFSMKPGTSSDCVKIEYSSSDPNVATVDNDGNITTTGRGETTITRTSTDSQGHTVTDTYEITVKFSFGQWLIWILLLGFLWY